MPRRRGGQGRGEEKSKIEERRRRGMMELGRRYRKRRRGGWAGEDSNEGRIEG